MAASRLPVSPDTLLSCCFLLRRWRHSGLTLRSLKQSVALATAELWPRISNTLLIPLAGAARAKTQQGRSKQSCRANSTATTSLADRTGRRSPFPAHARPRLPNFLRDTDVVLPSPILARSAVLRNTTSLGIFSETSIMASRTSMMASSLFRRSFLTLTSRPLGTPSTLRLMSTSQPIRPRDSFRAPVTYCHLPSRGLSTGSSVSRAVLSSREAAANRNPGSATAQNGFYQALLKADMPAIVVERYKSGMPT